MDTSGSAATDDDEFCFGGDVDGNGFSDVLIGVPSGSNGQLDEGLALLYSGFDTDPAMGVFYNGSGGNPVCFFSEPAVLGQSWDSSVVHLVRTRPVLCLVVVQARSSSGAHVGGGELLVDLSSPRYLTLQAPVSGFSTPFSVGIPNVLSLAGTSATAQGVVVGGGYTLCNAFQFVVGF